MEEFLHGRGWKSYVMTVLVRDVVIRDLSVIGDGQGKYLSARFLQWMA